MDDFANRLTLLAQEYWYFLVSGIGLLLMLGAIFKWGWVLQRQGGRRSFLNLLGDTGYRIAMFLMGLFLIIFSFGYAYLLGAIGL